MTRTNDASEVSFTSEMKVFDSGGTLTLAACGRMMRRSVMPRDIPAVYAASVPLRDERMAARITSAAYPPTLAKTRGSRSAMTWNHDADRGQPEKITNSCTISGVPQMVRTAAVRESRRQTIARQAHERDTERDQGDQYKDASASGIITMIPPATMRPERREDQPQGSATTTRDIGAEVLLTDCGVRHVGAQFVKRTGDGFGKRRIVLH